MRIASLLLLLQSLFLSTACSEHSVQETTQAMEDSARASAARIPLKIVLPAYPEIAWQARRQGTVEVEVVVRNGLVVGTDVLSDPRPELDGAVLQAVRSWVYESPPGPIQAVRLRLNFEFRLRGGNPFTEYSQSTFFAPDTVVIEKVIKLYTPQH